MANDFTYDNFLKYKNVPRGTFLRLECFVELLKKWQKTINLISDSTISDVWIRHIIDSIQLYDHITDDAVVDIGSGAGFPGMILAILGIKNMTLVESDTRKTSFLREAARVTNTTVTIINKRAEEISLGEFSIVTARGCASILSLFNMLQNTLNNSHNILLLKGKNYINEIKEAQKEWSFDCKATPSITDNEGVVLSLTHLHRQGA